MNTDVIRSDWTGRTIDERFPLLQWLGGSEWSGVFLTELPEDRSLKAAIKLSPVDSRDEEARIGAWAATVPLTHPHLMRLFHTGYCQIGPARLFFAVTEYAEEDLSQILPDRPLTPAETIEMLGPVLDALSYLHGQRLVHGHIKPSNIMVAGDRIKLSCDALHIAGGDVRRFPAPGVYDAPQGATGTISPAADIWSLGITLVEALTQQPPAWNKTTHKEPIVPAFIAEPFADIARECLRPELERRCSLRDVVARLEPARLVPQPVDPQPIILPAAPAVIHIGGPGHAKLRATALVLALLVLLGGLAALQLRPRFNRPLRPGEQQSFGPAAAPSAQSTVPAGKNLNRVVVKGAVAERAFPDLLQSAVETIRGTVQVVVRVNVDANGIVSDAELESPGTSKYFANQALHAARSVEVQASASGRPCRRQSVGSAVRLQTGRNRGNPRRNISLEPVMKVENAESRPSGVIAFSELV